MSWSNVCVEGFCFGDTDAKGNYPCGKNVPSPFCLLNNLCPHFGWSDTTERDVAYFIPSHIIAWDKLKIWVTEDLYWKLRWWFWDCLWFNRRKVRKFFDSIPSVSAEDCPALAEYEVGLKRDAGQFKRWLPKALKGDAPID